jgi:hypothetical protein
VDGHPVHGKDTAPDESHPETGVPGCQPDQ